MDVSSEVATPSSAMSGGGKESSTEASSARREAATVTLGVSLEATSGTFGVGMKSFAGGVLVLGADGRVVAEGAVAGEAN